MTYDSTNVVVVNRISCDRKRRFATTNMKFDNGRDPQSLLPTCHRHRLLSLCINVILYETKYMILSRDQNAGRSYSMKIDNSSIERVEEFKYLGTTLTNKFLFRKKLRTDWSWGMLAIIRCRILYIYIYILLLSS